MRNMASCNPHVLLGMVFLTLVGCGRPEAPPTATESKATGYTIGVSMANLDGPRQTQIKADIEAEAAKYPDVRLIVTDAQNDAAKQRVQLAKFGKERVNAAIVNPVDAHFLIEPIAQLFDKGIPVVVLDRPVIGNHYSCFIAPDPRQMGAAAGQWMAKRLAGKGKIVELRGPIDSFWADELHKAFRAELRDPGYRFVCDVHVDPPKIDPGVMMRKALADVDEIDAVFAYNDAAARAAYEAAKTAGREKNILFVGVGGLPDEGAAYVSHGILTASIMNPTGGAQAVDAVMKLLKGGESPKTIVPATHSITRK